MLLRYFNEKGLSESQKFYHQGVARISVRCGEHQAIKRVPRCFGVGKGTETPWWQRRLKMNRFVIYYAFYHREIFE